MFRCICLSHEKKASCPRPFTKRRKSRDQMVLNWSGIKSWRGALASIKHTVLISQNCGHYNQLLTLATVMAESQEERCMERSLLRLFPLI